MLPSPMLAQLSRDKACGGIERLWNWGGCTAPGPKGAKRWAQCEGSRRAEWLQRGEHKEGSRVEDTGRSEGQSEEMDLVPHLLCPFMLCFIQRPKLRGGTRV